MHGTRSRLWGGGARRKARILVHPLLGPINVNGPANQRCLRTIIEERLCRIVNWWDTILSFFFFRLWNFDERTGMKMEMEMERKRMLSRVSRPNNKVGHERGRKRRRRRRSWLRRNTRDGLWSLITRVKYRLSNWFCSFPSYERAIARQCIAIVARPSVILLWNDTRNIWERKRKRERKIKLLLSPSCDRYIINPRNIMFLLRVLSQFKITCVNKMLYR